LNSPYATGLWIDIDCEILGSLEPLFSYCSPSSQIAIAREYTSDHLPKFDPGAQYNGGVVVFEHGAKIIEKWAEMSVSMNDRLVGDDAVLSYLIYQEHLDVVELPEIYNWRMMKGLNLDAVVIHWVSSSKNYIKSHGGLKPSLDAFFQSCKGLKGLL
jgi:lipopolysaccharide biosynthesis glycosyltransferase